ncbi:MAG: hypothetical protein IIV05_00255, partial [Ruminococcus sp.]|nr:hypothetical protein [Ruminococcus sp.]
QTSGVSVANAILNELTVMSEIAKSIAKSFLFFKYHLVGRRQKFRFIAECQPCSGFSQVYRHDDHQIIPFRLIAPL